MQWNLLLDIFLTKSVLFLALVIFLSFESGFGLCLHQSGSGDALPVKRGPGRPPGTGPKQIAAQLALAQGDSASVEKRPVGRPRKHPRIDKSSGVHVDMGKIVCFPSFVLDENLMPVLDCFTIVHWFKVI
jgi:hypothetical protein